MYWLNLIASITIFACGLGLIYHAHALLVKKQYSTPALSEFKDEQKPLAAKIRGWESFAMGIWFVFVTSIVNILHLPAKYLQIIIAGGALIKLLANSAVRRRLTEQKAMFTAEEWPIILLLVVVLPVAFGAIFNTFGIIPAFSVLGGFVAALIIIERRRSAQK